MFCPAIKNDQAGQFARTAGYDSALENTAAPLDIVSARTGATAPEHDEQGSWAALYGPCHEGSRVIGLQSRTCPDGNIVDTISPLEYCNAPAGGA